MKRRGFTLVEALVASAISVGAIAVSTLIYFSGMGTWAKGRGDIDSMAATQVAVKKVAKELQEAITVSVANDGLSVSYELPRKDGSGNYLSPAKSDGVNRSFLVSAGSLTQVINGTSRTLATNVLLKDPATNQSFVPFEGDGNAMTRSVAITIATEKNGQGSHRQSSCASETVYLRNIPRKKS